MRDISYYLTLAVGAAILTVSALAVDRRMTELERSAAFYQELVERQDAAIRAQQCERWEGDLRLGSGFRGEI